MHCAGSLPAHARAGAPRRRAAAGLVDPAHRACVADALRAAAPAAANGATASASCCPAAARVRHEARGGAPGHRRRTVWHGFIADVTDQRIAGRRGARRRPPRRASRAKSRFLARMSHELRTLLNGIPVRAPRCASTRPHAQAEQRRRLGIIEDSGRSLTRLIDEVLDITRIEQGGLALRREPVPAPAAGARAAHGRGTALARGITLALVDCPPQLAVLADRDRLAQVLANLLSNAVKYDRPRRPRHAHRPQGRLRRAHRRRRHRPGLSEDQQRQLFQPFNRLGAERMGSKASAWGC